MKAMLIIDIPDDFTIKGSYANCTIFEGGKHRMWNRITEIKPLPHKMQENYMVFGDEVVWQKAVGYNWCLDEILGETE